MCVRALGFGPCFLFVSFKNAPEIRPLSGWSFCSFRVIPEKEKRKKKLSRGTRKKKKDDRGDVLFKGFASQERGQDSNQVLDQVSNHPGLEKAPCHVLTASLALMLALIHAFLARCDLEIESLEVMTIEK